VTWKDPDALGYAHFVIAVGEDQAVWEARIERLRDYIAQKLDGLRSDQRRRLDADDLVQDALTAWVEAGARRGEFISPQAIAVVERALRPVAAEQRVRSLDAGEHLPVRSDDDLSRREFHEILRQAIRELPGRHRRGVAELRLLAFRPKVTQAEVGRRLGISISRVGQIEHEVVNRLMSRLRSDVHRRHLVRQAGWLSRYAVEHPVLSARLPAQEPGQLKRVGLEDCRTG